MIGYDLDELLLDHKRFWKMESVLERTVLSRKALDKKIDEMNVWLIEHHQKEIEIKNNVIAFPEIVDELEEMRFGIKNPLQLIFKTEERQNLFFLFVFYDQSFWSITRFKSVVNTSKNTILADIKQLRQRLLLHHISLEFQMSKGFYLFGKEEAIRSFAFQALQNLSTQAYYCLSKQINQKEKLQLFDVNDYLKKVIKTNQIKVVESRYQDLLFFTELLSKRIKSHPINQLKKITIPNLDLCDQNFDEETKIYFIALLLGSSDGAINNSGLDFLYRVSFKIMENVMKLGAMEFEDFTKTFEALLAHLSPAYFRLTYHLELKNHLISRIKQEYLELFKLIEYALEPLSALTGKIAEDELAYFVILFGGEIYKKRHHNALKAIVLCANGISSSLIMKKRLEDLFPNMDFVIATSVSQLDEIPVSTYDIIFSTLNVESSKKVYLFSPFPSNREVRKLYNQLVRDFELPSPPIFSEDQLIKLLKPFLKKEVNLEEVREVLQQKIELNITMRGDESPMLSDLLKGNTIQFTNKKLDWKEAIALASQPLLDSNTIEPAYITAMIDRIKSFGPFVDLGMGIALPHARPEDGVNKVGMSFLRCENPVALLNDPAHEIKIFIVLSAVDNEAHLKALSALTGILSNSEELQNLLDAANVKEVEAILAQ